MDFLITFLADIQRLFNFLDPAMTSLFVALISLGVAITTTIQGRQHNRLSVRPYLTAHQHTDTDADTEQSSISFTLTNSGLGVALIEHFEIKYKGITLGNHRSLAKLNNSLLQTLQAFFHEDELTHAHLYRKGAAISANKSTKILEVTFKQINSKDKRSLEEAETFLENLDLLIKYKSLYGTPQTLDTAQQKDLDT